LKILMERLIEKGYTFPILRGRLLKGTFVVDKTRHRWFPILRGRLLKRILATSLPNLKKFPILRGRLLKKQQRLQF